MVIFPLAPDQTIAQMWSNGARGALALAPTQLPTNDARVAVLTVLDPELSYLKLSTTKTAGAKMTAT